MYNCFQVKYKNYNLNYCLPNSISNTNYNFKYKLQVEYKSQVIPGQVQVTAFLMLLDHGGRMP